MWQNILTAIIVAIALIFIGRKLYYQLRKAIDPSQNVSCGCGCSGCNTDNCNSRKKEK